MADTHNNYQTLYNEKKRSIDGCLDIIHSNDVVVSMPDNNEPEDILRAFHTIAPRVENVILQKGANGMFKAITEPGLDGRINSTGYYFGAAQRLGSKLGSAFYVACDIPDFEPFFGSVHPCTVFMASVTPMDENGNFYASLCRQWGDVFIKTANRVILEINDNLPYMPNGLRINIADVTCLYESNHGLWELSTIHATDDERKVAQNCRALLRDGDCIQLGIGGLPNAIAEAMFDLQDLGIHTEMVTSTMGEMIRRGIVTGARKNFHPGEHIGSFAGGDMALYKTLAEDPKCRLLPGTWVVDPMIIKQNDNMVSINTAVEMDLTGQICAESVGPMQLSGTGGAFDFAYGALHAKGGRGIYAFLSTTNKGFSKINCLLKEGAQVSVPRNYADYVVTEYSIAPLRGRTTRERAENLIAVSHPDLRAKLRAEAKQINIL